MNLCRNEVIPENNVTLNFGVFESILKNRLFRDGKWDSLFFCLSFVYVLMPSLFLNFNKCSYTIQSVDISIIIEGLSVEPPQVRRVGWWWCRFKVRVTHDLQPTIDRIRSGKLFTFRHDGSTYYNNVTCISLEKYQKWNCNK